MPDRLEINRIVKSARLQSSQKAYEVGKESDASDEASIK